MWAYAGHVTALLTLASHYPASLSRGAPLLRVLDALPETLDPRMYSALLPKVRLGRRVRLCLLQKGGWERGNGGSMFAKLCSTALPKHCIYFIYTGRLLLILSWFGLCVANQKMLCGCVLQHQILCRLSIVSILVPLPGTVGQEMCGGLQTV